MLGRFEMAFFLLTQKSTAYLKGKYHTDDVLYFTQYHFGMKSGVQWNPFLTTSQIATTVAITTDLQIPVFSFI